MEKVVEEERKAKGMWKRKGREEKEEGNGDMG
jgi:hypothetical protein